MIEPTLKKIGKELDEAEKRTKDEVMQEGIDNSLSLSLAKYLKNLKRTCEFLLSRSTVKMVNAIANRFGNGEHRK